VTRVVVLTAVDVEAGGLARHLGLARVDGADHPRFRAGALELVCVGPGARYLDARVGGLPAPALVVSAGVCGALAPHLRAGALIVPEAVVDAGGARLATAEVPGLPRSGTLLGVTAVVATPDAKTRLWLATGALACDMESAAILAWAATRGVPAAVIRKAKGLLRTPGLSVLPEAELACELAPVHAMHDPTEGGIATALHELAEAAGVGLRIDADRITVLPEGRELCAAFGLDPLGTIASGALLLTLAPADAAIVIHALAREGIDSHFIGQVVPRAEGVTLVAGGRRDPLPEFPRDEITKLFERT